LPHHSTAVYDRSVPGFPTKVSYDPGDSKQIRSVTAILSQIGTRSDKPEQWGKGRAYAVSAHAARRWSEGGDAQISPLSIFGCSATKCSLPIAEASVTDKACCARFSQLGEHSNSMILHGFVARSRSRAATCCEISKACHQFLGGAAQQSSGLRSEVVEEDYAELPHFHYRGNFTVILSNDKQVTLV
jgi:hypothetical protein